MSKKEVEPISSILPFLLNGAKAVLGVQFLLTVLSTFEGIGPIDRVCAPVSLEACSLARNTLVSQTYLDSCAYNPFDIPRMVVVVAMAIVCLVAQLLVSKAHSLQANTLVNVEGWANIVDEMADVINTAEKGLADPEQESKHGDLNKLKDEATAYMKYMIILGRARPIEKDPATLLRKPEVKYFCDARNSESKACNTYGTAALVVVVTAAFASSIWYLFRFRRGDFTETCTVDTCIFSCQPLRSWWQIAWLVFMTCLLAALIVAVAHFRNKFGVLISQTFWSHAWHKDADIKVRVARVALAARHHICGRDQTNQDSISKALSDKDVSEIIMWLREADEPEETVEKNDEAEKGGLCGIVRRRKRESREQIVYSTSDSSSYSTHSGSAYASSSDSSSSTSACEPRVLGDFSFESSA